MIYAAETWRSPPSIWRTSPLMKPLFISIITATTDDRDILTLKRHKNLLSWLKYFVAGALFVVLFPHVFTVREIDYAV
jgi:hypothetical protein